MKRNRSLAFPVLFALVFAAAAYVLVAGDSRPIGEYSGRIATRLAGMLPRYHVLQRPLDDSLSCTIWSNLVTFYDFDHSVFLETDLERLATHKYTIDDELREGDVSFGKEIHALYCERLKERVEFATNLLAAAEWDFTTNEFYRIKRKDAPWPATREDAESHWRRRLKNEVLAMRIARELDAEKKAAKKPADSNADETGDVVDEADEEGTGNPADTPEQSLVKKYRQYYVVLTDPDEEAILQHYLSAVCHAYDPHSDYMSPMTKEDFDMDMNLTLCGVGAVLSADDGALKISEIIPGGPVDLDGRIHEGDKIIGVKQENGEMEDIMWQPMNKSVHMIRGKKGTRVTLQIIPRSDPTGATTKLIELVRDEMKLDEQAATGHVERVECGGFETAVGYVHLPSFYGSMDKAPGTEGYMSCSADVARYIAQFNSDGVDAIVLDLRGNGGGSLKEAVLLSSLFVPSGPVVVIRDARSQVPLPIPDGNPVAFRKPVTVLVDRASASASEIVAGHLRDTGRAIVLGDERTHGKGTVQTVLGMGPEKYGSTKITTARFYRINGRSTQVEGVESDIHLPSFLDSLDIGEDKLPNALPFTMVRPLNYKTCWNLDTYVPELKALSKARTDADARFRRHVENVAAAAKIYEREDVPLEYGARKAMMAADRLVTDKDPESDADEEESAVSRRRRKKRGDADDLVLQEAYRITADLVRLNGDAKLPPQAVDWYNALLGF